MVHRSSIGTDLDSAGDQALRGRPGRPSMMSVIATADRRNEAGSRKFTG
jgi:hypothetical protein